MPTERCNRVLVERYFLGESGAEEKRAVRAHLDDCAQCRGHLSTLENERRDYLMAHPFREFAAKHLPEEKTGRKQSTAPRWLPALAGLVACLVLVPVVLRYGMRGNVVTETGVRTKGGPVLEYYLKRGGAVTPGQTSELHRAGDELQFVYAAGSHAYVTLASIDSRGHVSLYGSPQAVRPARENPPADSGIARTGGSDTLPVSLAAKAGEKQTLPFAVTLDDSPGSELFVMIFGSLPLTGGGVEGWLTEAYTRASGNLEGLVSRLSPPPGSSGGAEGAGKTGAGGEGKPAGKGGAEVKTLLLRKTQA
ncbi:MAG: hypothetical protein JWO30_4135 [Fibrobacteres bacterium]|nr:hypothetical protein [Fibrobacterota bacterium]